MRKLIAAIDLGTSKVVCMVGEKTEAGVKIIAMNEAPSKGVSRGEVVNIQSALESIMPTIQNVENAIGEKIKDVFIGIAGQSIKCEQGTDQTVRINPDELIVPAEIEEITITNGDDTSEYVSFSDEPVYSKPETETGNAEDWYGDGFEILANTSKYSRRNESNHRS